MEKDKDKENNIFDSDRLRYIHKYQSKCISNNTNWIRVQDSVQDVLVPTHEKVSNSSSKAISNCTKRLKNESGHHRAVLLNGNNISLNSITAGMILGSDDIVAVYLSDVTNINQNRLDAMFRELINRGNQTICSESGLRESPSDNKSNDHEQKEWKIDLFVPDMVNRMDQQFHSLQSILLDCESMRNYEQDNSFTNKSYNKTFYNHCKVNDRTKLTRLPCSVKRKDESLLSIAELKKSFSFPAGKLVQDQAVDIVNQSVPMTDITKRRRLEMRKRAEERYNAAINSSSSESSADES